MSLHTRVTCQQLSRRHTPALLPASLRKPKSRRMALVAYRNLLRSARIAFQGTLAILLQKVACSPSVGDMNTLFAARAEARRNFESHRDLPAGSEETSKQVAHAEEVAKFLRENVVQGQAAETQGNYSRSSKVPIERWMLIAILQSYGYMSIPSEETMRISRK